MSFTDADRQASMDNLMPQERLKLLVLFYMRYYGCSSKRDAIQQIRQDLKEVK